MARVVGGRWMDPGVFEPQVIPTGFGIAAGSAIVTASAMVAAAVPASAAVARLAVVAVPLAVFVASPVTVAAAAATGVLAFLVVDGFLVNTLGQLSWHGAVDGWRLLTLAAAVVAGLLAGAVYRDVRRRLCWRRWMRWVTTQPRTTEDLITEAAWTAGSRDAHEGIVHG
jgi:MFS family permease